MASTAVQQGLFEPVVDSPTHPAATGPLADVVNALTAATELIRSVEARLVEAATDTEVAMLDLATVIEAANHAGRAAAGIETHATAGYARRDEVYDQDTPFEDPRQVVRGRGFIHDDAGLEIAHVLRLSEGSGETRTARAAALTSRLPLTLAGLVRGDVELWQAHAILDETRLLNDEEAREVDTWLHSRLGATDPVRLRAVTRYAIGRVNPDAIRHRAAKSRADRTLQITPAEQPGLSHIYALVPSHHAAAIWEASTTLATQYQALDAILTADQARADAFVDLILADVEVSAQVTLGMPIVTSSTSSVGQAHDAAPPGTGEPDDAAWPDEERHSCDPITPDPRYDGPGRAPDRIPDWLLNEIANEHTDTSLSCQIDGAGPLAGTLTTGVTLKTGYIPADAIAALFTHLDLTIARALIDATDGTIRETVTGAYRPTKKMREYVTLRDGTCRMYGCTRTAVACDLDHAIPHDQGGQTSPANLAALCRHHHRAKQAKHWTYTLSETGEATWTCRRTGTVRRTAPATALAAGEAHRRAHESVLDTDPPAPTITTTPADPGPPPF